MPYTLHEDNLARDARWMTLAGLNEPLGDLLELSAGRRRTVLTRLRLKRDQLQASYWRMSLETAAQRDDGYLTLAAALACCEDEPWILKALTTAACGKPPLVHRRGDSCSARNCIGDSPPWTEGYQFRICAFLKRNPSRKEVERNQAQRKDLRDPVLRAYLFDRDVCCRYCRSGPLKRKGMGNAKDHRRSPVIEHVDPDRDALPDRSNAVLACRACNEYKGRRTPAEAGIDLLPEPTAEQIAYWTERGEQQFDRPEPGHPSPADNPPDKRQDNALDKRQDKQPTSDMRVVSPLVQGVVHGVVSASTDPAVSAGQPQGQAPDNTQEASLSGRVGSGRSPPVSSVNGQPIRAPDAPDIYHRRSRPGAAAS
ncbi:MAG: HNH endonuclease [Gammaproteobacteria bacterium]